MLVQRDNEVDNEIDCHPHSLAVPSFSAPVVEQRVMAVCLDEGRSSVSRLVQHLYLFLASNRFLFFCFPMSFSCLSIVTDT